MSADRGRRFEAEELRRFLTAVDRHLTSPAQIIIIGGSALALYGVPAGTADIDTYQSDLAPLRRALERARQETGLDIPVNPAGVADVPRNFEDRLQQGGTWTRLRVFVLERHDLALSKAMRGYENDLVAIERLHAISPLELQTLVERYVNEMGEAIGNPARLDSNVVLMVNRLFGDIEADRIQKMLHDRRKPKVSTRKRKAKTGR